MEGNVIELSSDSSAPPSPRNECVVSSGLLADVPSEQDDLLSISDVHDALGITQPRAQVHCISDSEESVVAVTENILSYKEDGGVGSSQSPEDVVAKKRPRAQGSKMAGRRQCSDEERRRREEEKQRKEEVRRQKQRERIEKREKQLQDRRMKAAQAEAARMMQPGHCLKYFYAKLDSVLLTEVYGGEMLVALQGAEVQYKIQAMVVPRMISWARIIPWKNIETQLQEWKRAEDNAVEEEEVLLVQPWSEVVEMVHSGTLCTHVHSLKTAIPGKKLTLVIYGMDQYFRYQKARKNREFRGFVLGRDKSSHRGNAVQEPSLQTAAVISSQQLDEALAEVQLFADCCHRLVESPSALGALVAQFSKAIAEKPFKLEKQRKEQENFNWFAVADSKDCVPVDVHGNGLLRLWKQQLCQFNLASLETAEAIASKYRSPQSLMEAYDQCTSQQSAELLLQEIPIRRALGPLTSMRRVGPQLSKKIYRFFTAEDGQTPLSQE